MNTKKKATKKATAKKAAKKAARKKPSAAKSVYSAKAICGLKTKWQKLVASTRACLQDEVMFVAKIFSDHGNDRTRCARWLTEYLAFRSDQIKRYLDLVNVLKYVKSVRLWRGLSPTQLKKLAAMRPAERKRLVGKLGKELTDDTPVLSDASWGQLYQTCATPAAAASGIRKEHPARDLAHLRRQFARLVEDAPILIAGLQGWLDARSFAILHLSPSSQTVAVKRGA